MVKSPFGLRLQSKFLCPSKVFTGTAVLSLLSLTLSSQNRGLEISREVFHDRGSSERQNVRFDDRFREVLEDLHATHVLITSLRLQVVTHGLGLAESFLGHFRISISELRRTEQLLLAELAGQSTMQSQRPHSVTGV
jgi:hypothetical protein